MHSQFTRRNFSARAVEVIDGDRTAREIHVSGVMKPEDLKPYRQWIDDVEPWVKGKGKEDK